MSMPRWRSTAAGTISRLLNGKPTSRSKNNRLAFAARTLRSFISCNGSRHASTALLAAWQPSQTIRVEVHRTPDIVGQPPAGKCDCIVVPSNEALEGTQRSYFPVGGPCPEEPPKGVTNFWGGMEAGAGMMYPTQCVDGCVHVAGGPMFRAACAALPEIQPGIRCPVGHALLMPSQGTLRDRYNYICCTVAPFRSHPEWEARLRDSFTNIIYCLEQVDKSHSPEYTTAAIPLLGSGARGSSHEAAAKIAAQAVEAFANRDDSQKSRVLRFVANDTKSEAALLANFSIERWSVSVAA